MKKSFLILFLLASFSIKAQDDTIKNIITEATENSHLEILEQHPDIPRPLIIHKHNQEY